MKSRRLETDGQASIVNGFGVAVAAGLIGATTVAYCRQRRKRELATLTSRLQKQVQQLLRYSLYGRLIKPLCGELHDHNKRHGGGVGSKTLLLLYFVNSK